MKDQDSNPGRLTSKRVHAATHRKQLRLGVSEKASPKQGLGSWILRDGTRDANGGNGDRRQKSNESKLPGRKFMTCSGWIRIPKGKQTTKDKVGGLTLQLRVADGQVKR